MENDDHEETESIEPQEGYALPAVGISEISILKSTMIFLISWGGIRLMSGNNPVGIDTLAQGIILLALLCFFVCSTVNWKKPDKKENTNIASRLQNLQYPTLFLSIGIFGTFLGIYAGLSGLPDRGLIDTSALQGLIDDLVTSFTTSLMGILLTIEYRVFTTKPTKPQKKEVGIPELISEIQIMSEKLDTFIDDLSKKVVDGLGEALQGLTTQLENVLSDQLGEAFRSLEKSIADLNQWVIEYREEVRTLTEAYKSNLISIEEYNKRAQEVVDSLKPLPDYMKGIETTLEKMNIPLTEFTKLGESASDALPIIQDNLDAVKKEFEKLSESAKGNFAIIQDNLEDTTESFLKSTEGLVAAQTGFSQASEKLDEAQTEFVQYKEKINKAQNEQIEELNKTQKEQIEKHAEGMARISKQFTDDLASISEKFAKDYIPIAEGLKQALKQLDARKNNEQ